MSGDSNRPLRTVTCEFCTQPFVAAGTAAVPCRIDSGMYLIPESFECPRCGFGNPAPGKKESPPERPPPSTQPRKNNPNYKHKTRTADLPRTRRVEIDVRVGGTDKKRMWWVFGKPLSAVIRWMGSEGWTREDAERALRLMGVVSSPDTVRSQLDDARPWGDHKRGPAAELTAEQKAALNRLVYPEEPRP